MKQILITVSPQGKTTVETQGYQGAACQAASRFLEVALGQRTGEVLTSAYHTAAIDSALITTTDSPTPRR